MSEKQYAERDIIEMDRQGGYYARHVQAMTAEGLHNKSDIAAELAHRDMEIDRLKKDNHRHCTSLMTTAMWEGLEEERDAALARAEKAEDDAEKIKEHISPYSLDPPEECAKEAGKALELIGQYLGDGWDYFRDLPPLVGALADGLGESMAENKRLRDELGNAIADLEAIGAVECPRCKRWGFAGYNFCDCKALRGEE